MDFLPFFKWLNNDFLAIPVTVLFFGVAVILTAKTGFLQVRALPRFIKLLIGGVSPTKSFHSTKKPGTIGSINALFTAMASTIGIGNIVSPSLAIISGGPGALFWLVFYILIGSATKFTEVVFALHTRIKTDNGHIIGGPMYYLAQVKPWLAAWYGCSMALLMAGWSGVQANTLASILAQESIPAWLTGIMLAIMVGIVLKGGAKRVGNVATGLVPTMFVCYVSFSLFILLSQPYALIQAFKLIGQHIFSSTAALSGLTAFGVMRIGICRGIFITESGLGTSSIPHAMADVENPSDQGILAMFSAGADAFLSLLSGLLVLVTGIWLQGDFRSTLIYEIFKNYSPSFGRYILMVSITLFAITTVIGNSFNGRQSFASITNFRFIHLYILFTTCIIMIGSLSNSCLIWEMMDTALIFVAIPNLIGVLYLAFKNPGLLKI